MDSPATAEDTPPGSSGASGGGNRCFVGGCSNRAKEGFSVYGLPAKTGSVYTGWNTILELGNVYAFIQTCKEDDLCSYNELKNGFSGTDELIKDLPNLETGMDTDMLDENQLASNCFADELGDPWFKLGNGDATIGCNIADGIHIKSEPLSPPSSSCSDASGDSMPPSQINFLNDPSRLYYQYDSPPLTPPREATDVPTPLLPTATPISNGSTVINTAPVKPKTQRTCRQPIAPKIEPRCQPTNTITVKQIPVGQPIVLTQAEIDRLTAQGLIKCEPKQQQPSPTTSQLSISTTIPVSQCIKAPVSPIPEPPPNVDVKAWKRQQRMIKNRESACLSRKKKKEYLQGLENHIHDLNSENEKLRHENSSLRKRLETLQTEITSLKKVQSLLPSSNKTTACLFTVLLFVGFNLAPISILSSPDDAAFASQHSGRALLSYSEDSTEVKIRQATLSEEFSVGDNANRSEVRLVMSSESTNHTSALEQARELMVRGFADYMMSKGPLSCPKLNSTETHRLADVLMGWAQQHQDEQRKKTEENQQKEKEVKRKKRASARKRLRNSLKDSPPPTLHVESEEKSLQLYDSLFQSNYANLLNALDRRDDTFYVVSFRKDHLLLPATAHNNTQRPRMSLVMPAVGTNKTSLNAPSDHFTMMQIDCEVMNTKVVRVKDEPITSNKNETIPPHVPHTNDRPVIVNTADEGNHRHPKNIIIP